MLCVTCQQYINDDPAPPPTTTTAPHALCDPLLQPTNHLDAESVAWLERFLADFKGTVVAVTHDRWGDWALSTA